MPESGRSGKDAAEEAGRRLGDDMRDADGGIRIDDIYIEPPPPPALTFETDGPRCGHNMINNLNYVDFFF